MVAISSINRSSSSSNSSKIATASKLQIAVLVFGSIAIARYIWKTYTKRGHEHGKLNASSDEQDAGRRHESLIPFTVTQNMQPILIRNNKFATVEYDRIPSNIQLQRSKDFYTFMNYRRSFRQFSFEPVDMEVLRNCIKAANTAPSGAHMSPWTFMVITDKQKRKEIRRVVEAEEQTNYDRRMKKTWVDALKPVTSNLHSQGAISKPYLEEAPYLVVLLKEHYRWDANGNKIDNYYPAQSTGIAAGIFIAALHNANLVTLPTTPMGAEAAIKQIIGRKENEKVFLLMPVGRPHKNATIPYRNSKEWRKDINKAMVVV